MAFGQGVLFVALALIAFGGPAWAQERSESLVPVPRLERSESASSAISGIKGSGAFHPRAVSTRVPAEPTRPLLDNNTLFLGCLLTGSAGAMLLAHPTPGDWAVPGGWHIGVPATALRMGLGCFYGVLAGMTVSVVGYFWPP